MNNLKKIISQFSSELTEKEITYLLTLNIS